MRHNQLIGHCKQYLAYILTIPLNPSIIVRVECIHDICDHAVCILERFNMLVLFSKQLSLLTVIDSLEAIPQALEVD